MPRIRVKRVVLATLLLAVAAAAAWTVHLRTAQVDYLTNRGGELEATELDSQPADDAGEIRASVRLRGSDGLRVDLRVRRFAGENGPQRTLLLLGGHRTGKDAVDLAQAADGVAYVAIDYPYTGPEKLSGVGRTLRATPAIQRAFLDTPPALSLTVDWLLTQPWVDPDAIEMIGVSLGSPFAATAAALDERIARLWLIHGAGDNRAWLNHNLKEQFPTDWSRGVVTEVFYTLIYAESFRTERWIEAMLPRPVVLIAAHDDERLPERALQPLVELAENHAGIDLIWTDGMHVQPNRPDIVQQLLRIVLERGSP